MNPPASGAASGLGALAAALCALPARFHVSAQPSPSAVSLAELADPAVAQVLVRRHRAVRQLDRHTWRRASQPTQIAASLTVQGIAMRLGGTALAAAVLHGKLLTTEPEDVFVDVAGPMFDLAIRRGDAVAIADRHELVAAWGAHWLDGHFTGLVDAVTASHRVGRTMLWDNVASAVASSMVFFDWWDPALDARAWAAEVLALGTPPLARTTTMCDLQVGGRCGLRSERSSCCLAKLVPDGHICPTCPKVSEAARLASTEQHVQHLFAVRRGEAVGPPR